VNSGGKWTQQAEITASDGQAEDWFGSSLSLDGKTLLVGAPDRKLGPDENAGTAYFFVQSGESWTQQAEFPTPAESTNPGGESGDQFGLSVALSGNTAVIGSPYKWADFVGIAPDEDAGAAYVFV
jgi:hypothetical protein